MANPLRFYIVPDCVDKDCGLEIKLKDGGKDGLLHHPQKPMPFTLTINPNNPNTFTLKEGGKIHSNNEFHGNMSPLSKVTLPSKIRADAGIHKDAERFAYMHPPEGIGALIDWEKDYHRLGDDEGKKAKVKTPSKAEKKIGRAHAMLFGAFIYFDKNMEILSVNALTFQKMNYSLSFCGPWEARASTITSMIELERLHTIPIQSFQEGGIVAAGWANPGEMFESKRISVCDHGTSGALVFMREDGTGIAYHVTDEHGTYFPEEDVEIVVDCFLAVGIALLTEGKDVKFVQTLSDDRLETTPDQRGHVGALLEKNRWINLAEDEFESILEPNKLDKFGWSPLYYACRFASTNYDLIKYLVQNSSNMSAGQKDIFSRNPLHLACDGNASLEVIELLLKKYPKAVLGKTSTMELIPLHIACNRKAKIEVIRALIDADHDMGTLNARSIIERLPLHMAVEGKMDSEAIELLLEKGNESNIHTIFAGMTPLHSACFNKSKEDTVQLLLAKSDIATNLTNNAEVEHGEDIKEMMAVLSCDSHDKVGLKPLQLALIYSNHDAARLLLMRDGNRDADAKSIVLEQVKSSLLCPRDADAKSIVPEQGKTSLLYPLHLACQHNAPIDIISLILELDEEKKALHAEDKWSRKAIHYACNKCNADLKTIKALIEADEDFRVNKMQKMDGSALDQEIFEDNPHIETGWQKGDDEVKPLYRSLDWKHRSPLICSLKENSPYDVVEYLASPDLLYLKGFDHNYVTILGQMVSRQNSKMQRHVLDLLSQRQHFVVLFIEFYAHVGAISSFVEASERLNAKKKLTYVCPSILAACVIIFVLREVAQFKSQGWHYFKDGWNVPEYVSIIFSIRSIVHMRDYINSAAQDTFQINRTDLILTGNLLILTYIFYLRSTFLPFARFVGGLLLILTTLVPFFIVGSLLLLAFTLAYRISDHDCQEAVCYCKDSLKKCYLYTLQQFFSGSDDTAGALDIIFGVVAIVIVSSTLSS